jgi:RNA polymerase sigma-70 factor (ECF subfamily)
MPIDPATLKFARVLSRIKVRRAGRLIRRADRDDVEQELLLEVVVRWHRFDPRKATAEAFVERVVRDKFRNILRDRQRAKRDWRREQPLEVTVHDRPESSDELRRCELRIDVHAVTGGLPPQLRVACDQLRRESVSAVARGIGKPRSTLESALRRARASFQRCDLDHYLS